MQEAGCRMQDAGGRGFVPCVFLFLWYTLFNTSP